MANFSNEGSSRQESREPFLAIGAIDLCPTILVSMIVAQAEINGS